MKAGGAPPATPVRSQLGGDQPRALNEGGGRTPRNALGGGPLIVISSTLNEGGGRTPRNAGQSIRYCHHGYRTLNEGGGRTPRNAEKHHPTAGVALIRSMKAGGAPPATH